MASHLLHLLLLLFPFLFVQDRGTYTVLSHAVRGTILLYGQSEGKPAVLLLDAGANNSVVDLRAADFLLAGEG